MLKLSRKKKNAWLALAVAASILGGGTVFAAEPLQTTTEFTSTLTGNSDKDTEYKDGGVIKDDGKYVFEANSIIDVENKAAIDAKKAVTVDAGNNTLDLNVSGTSGDLAGIKADVGMFSGGNFINSINAKKLNITVENTGNGVAKGIKNEGNTLTVNSDVAIGVKSEGNASGIISEYLGTTINGNVDINITAKGNVANGVEVTYGGKFNADSANIDVTTGGSGAALKATYGYFNGGNGDGKSIIDIGSGTIKINSTGEEPVYSILIEQESGTKPQEVYINKYVTDKKVDILGNVKLTGATSDLTIGLATADSKLTGAIFSKEYEERSWVGFTPVTKICTPDVLLTLKNGAVWNNEVQGKIDKDFKGSYVSDFTGGDSAENAGYILQNDARNLTLENYAGHSVIIYKHTSDGSSEDHYADGDIIIKKAAEGSGIILSTDNSGITMDDEKQVTKTLNALAGKLTYNAYTNGEKNLSGKVQISDGLTASSAALKLVDIVFDIDTGKGGYGNLNMTTKDFTTSLTGDGSDTPYKEARVIQEDGSYKFTKDSTITLTDGRSAIDVKGDVVINAVKRTLNLKTDGSGTVYGISQASANKAEITADKLVINTTSNSRAEGIHMANSNAEIQPEMTIKGDVDVSVTGTSNVIGAYIQGNSVLNINGDVKMEIEGNNGGWGYYGASGLYSTSNMGANSMGATINVNGDVDIKGNANAIFANAGGSVVNVGGGKIEVDNSNKEYAALRAEDGVVNMNVVKDASGKAVGADINKVNIKGNIAVTTGAVNQIDKNGTLSQVNLGLSGTGSTLNGVIFNQFPDKGLIRGDLTFRGEANLWLQNGATWTNEVSGKVDSDFAGSKVETLNSGIDAEHAGNIFQKDNHALTINNYSGYTNIYYAHNNAGDKAEDYAAGDTIVKKAAKDSCISLITDNTGINMGSIDNINNVLNVLAGKLTYEAFASSEKNLSGKVQIADGLTASSAALQKGDITFDKETGKGGYIKKHPDEEQSKSEFTDVITGVRKGNIDYVMSGVLKDDGSYVFTKDSTNLPGINVSSELDQGLVINAAGKTLNMKNISNGTDKELHITAGDINIVKANSSGRTEGIHASSGQIVIDGNTNINVSGYDYTLGVYGSGNNKITFNGNVTMKGEAENKWGVDDHGHGYKYYGSTALYEGSNYGIQQGGTLNVNGNVDLVVNGNGAFANGGGSTVNISGGNIEINSERQLYALIAQSGYINMNMNDARDGAGSNKVNIKGNIGVLNGSVNSNEPCKDSIINLGLATKDSTWTGVIDNNFSESEVADGWTGTVNLYMTDGATWSNEKWGKTVKGFAGSHVAKFVGGVSEAKAGNIFQKDSNSLTIDNYSGNTNIFYAHTGNGEAAGDYAAGDTIIKSAAEGSVVSMITDNTGISMDSEESVANVLNTLAGKLTYSNFVNGEKNLTGYVKIADGLTASSAALKTGDIAFSTEDGKGSLKKEDVKPEPPTPTYPEDQKADKFDQGITGDDEKYKEEGVQKEDGSYVFTKNPTSIEVEKGAAVEATDKKINIDTTKAKLELKGETGIKANGTDVDIKGNTDISGKVGINAANGNVTLNGSSTISGTDAAINAGENANVNVNGNNSALNINGSINANGGNITVDSGKASSTINGNVNAANGGSVEISLNDKNSKLTGSYNVDGESSIVMNVKNGAVWELTDDEAAGMSLLRMAKAPAAVTAKGLTVNGGATKAETGYLDMTKRTKDLKIASYSGWETIIYGHENAGADVADYKSGDTIIDKAEKGSGVILSTDNSNNRIDMKDKNAVEATLKALAQKVTYKDHEANGGNLTGKVQIADGLTSSSKGVNIGTLHWDEKGKGKYNLDSINWNQIIEGDYETFVMKGVRSAATTSMHTWRDNMQDTYTGADLADADGMFAKALGGKTSSDVKGLKDSNTYYGVQVGYDKAAANGWHTGIAFDYRNGDSNYLLGGKGDNQMYSLGVYGVKSFENNAFFRVAAKVGRVENEYDVYNEIRSLKLHGDYKANAYGLTMEYGKTFGDEDTYFTPKAQLTWSQVGSKSYSAYTEKGARMDVDQDSYKSLVARLGFEAGVKSEKGRVYAGLFAAHEFNGDISASYFANDGDRKHTSFDGEETWMEMKLGGTYDFSNNAHLYADFAKDFNGNFERKWKLSAGLRFEF
nr:autotransporter outer membrane beta-barrel domain-containing protein [Phascolarctobacterium succinatutens]